MKLLVVVVGVCASLGIAHIHPRHSHASSPKLMGGKRFLEELKEERNIPPALQRTAAIHNERHFENNLDSSFLGKRENIDTSCGLNVGTCGPGRCCSASGWCGTGDEYCAAPDCQYAYGPGCDAHKMPTGNSTASVPRPNVGSIAYGGVGVYACKVPGDIAFTFDDGPYSYTADLLDKLKVYGAKATFFITGNNLGKGSIDTTPKWSNVIKRMVAEGHQIASHTWSHQNLSSLDAITFSNQIVYNEMAFRNILGYFPTYMRPPYSQCNAACEQRLATFGYHITYFDLDTAGYLNDDANLIQSSKDIWDMAINTSNSKTDSFLEIEHDIHYQTVYNLTDYILSSMYKRGYKSVTVGECLGDPAANWYRTPGVIVKPSQSISADGSCSAGVTCKGSSFGDCCSLNGYCGNTTDYCIEGCQPASGICKNSTTPAVPEMIGDLVISIDGSCSLNTTCLESPFGECCSQYNYCGSTLIHCDTGCQSAFGKCGIEAVSDLPISLAPTSVATSASTLVSSSASSSAPSSSLSSPSSLPPSSAPSLAPSSAPSSPSSASSSPSSAPSLAPSSAPSSLSSAFSSPSSAPSSQASSVASPSVSVKASTASSISTPSTSSSVVRVTTTSAISTPSKTSSVVSAASASATAPVPSPAPQNPIASLLSALSQLLAGIKNSSTSPVLKASTNGKCGGTTGFTCKGSKFGSCCSNSGKCSTLSCLSGCQKDYSLWCLN